MNTKQFNCAVALIVTILLFSCSDVLRAQCNGFDELCDRRYDEVAYLTTHNAYNAGQEGFLFPNHNFGIPRQLQDGVRGLMLDIYDLNGTVSVYHGFSQLGNKPLSHNLKQIKDFMDENPGEIVTIIFECYVSADDVEEVFVQEGLMDYLHTQQAGAPWPTLQEMIDSGRRLVVFSDRNDASPDQGWYHYVWKYAVETDFSNHNPNDFDCGFNRGSASNDLFIVNHFITDATLGIGLSGQAAIVNAEEFMLNRMLECQLEKLKFPNFPTIDFHQLGEPLEVVNILNGIVTTGTGPAFSNNASSSLAFPNPAEAGFSIRLPQSPVGTVWVSMTDLLGRSYYPSVRQEGNLVHIATEKLASGIYFYSVMDPEKRKVATGDVVIR